MLSEFICSDLIVVSFFFTLKISFLLYPFTSLLPSKELLNRRKDNHLNQILNNNSKNMSLHKIFSKNECKKNYCIRVYSPNSLISMRLSSAPSLVMISKSIPFPDIASLFIEFLIAFSTSFTPSSIDISGL